MYVDTWRRFLSYLGLLGIPVLTIRDIEMLELREYEDLLIKHGVCREFYDVRDVKIQSTCETPFLVCRDIAVRIRFELKGRPDEPIVSRVVKSSEASSEVRLLVRRLMSIIRIECAKYNWRPSVAYKYIIEEFREREGRGRRSRGRKR